MITYLDKDITTVQNAFVAHGVNCQGAMGSGVAGAIRKKWVEAFVQYMNEPIGKQRLGSVSFVYIERDNVFVCNAYTQEFYGHDGKKYASVEAITLALRSILVEASLDGHSVYMPRIGCGLGGLDWETEVKPIVEEASSLFPDINIFICEWGNK